MALPFAQLSQPMVYTPVTADFTHTYRKDTQGQGVAAGSHRLWMTKLFPTNTITNWMLNVRRLSGFGEQQGLMSQDTGQNKKIPVAGEVISTTGMMIFILIEPML
jgi:hypothetical protein